MDPDKNLIDVTTGDFGVSTTKTPFPIRHMARFTADPKRLADLYGAVFGLKPVGDTDRGSIFVFDGYFNQALLYKRVREEKNGFNHFGFKIRDIGKPATAPKRPACAAAPPARSGSPSTNFACTIPKATESIFQSKVLCRESRVRLFETGNQFSGEKRKGKRKGGID
jgi:hypothetical protein